MSKKSRSPINIRRIAMNATLIVVLVLLASGIFGLFMVGVQSIVDVFSPETKETITTETVFSESLGALPFDTKD